MDQRQHLRQEIDRAEMSLVRQVKELEHRATEVRERVTGAVSVRYQMQHRPLAVFMAAFGVGVVVGHLASR